MNSIRELHDDTKRNPNAYGYVLLARALLEHAEEEQMRVTRLLAAASNQLHQAHRVRLQAVALVGVAVVVMTLAFLGVGA